MASRRPLSSKALREAAESVRRTARERAAEREARAEREDPDASAVARRVYLAAVEARRTGESGDVAPVLWAPLVTAAEMMAVVVVTSTDLPDTEEMRTDVAAYFVAGFLAGGHGFDREHFEQWRQRAGELAREDVEPG